MDPEQNKQTRLRHESARRVLRAEGETQRRRHSKFSGKGSADDRNPASPHIQNTTMIHAVLVYEAMQDLYHQQ